MPDPSATLSASGITWPRVSIVTPSYNQGQFIEETIRSVLLQGYPNLEYIIIDGGSTDGSVEMIRKYEPWLAYWVSEPDRGQSDAINKGWRWARGEILAWLNSDDVYRSGSIAMVVETFLTQPAVGCVYGHCDCINEEGLIIGKLGEWEFNLRRLIRRCESPIPQPATFVSRSALDAVGMLDQDLHYAMDYDLWIRIGLRFPIVRVPQTLAAFRVHTRSKSVVDPLASRPDVIRTMRRLMKDNTLPATVREESKSAYLSTYSNLSIALSQRGQALSYLLLAIVQSRCRVSFSVWTALGKVLLGYRTMRFLGRVRRRLSR